MKLFSMRTGWTVLAAAALLAGCGGGGGDGGSDGGSEVPATALQSPAGLVAFQQGLNNSGTDSTSSPVELDNVTLPKSDTTEPIAVN